MFAEFPHARRREAASLTAHYVAGVLDRISVMSGLAALSQASDFHPGDRVRTLRGSLSGMVWCVLPDGRIEWQPDGGSALIALPESLLRETR